MTESSGQPYATSVTPNGIEIAYFVEPRRYYMIRATEKFLGPHAKPGGGPWIEVPSVSTIIEKTTPKQLSWWGMEMGAEGMIFLFNTGAIRAWQPPDRDRPILICPGRDGGYVAMGTDEAVRLLTQFKLDVNNKKDTAGDRGQAVHDVFEVWGKTGQRPDPEMFPQSERGYILALLKFLDDVPSLTTERQECMVASVKHKYAGRYDWRGHTTEEHQVVYKCTPARGDHYMTLAPSKIMLDVKSSKRIYDTHHIQLEMYESASVEGGDEPTDDRFILHVHPGDPYNDDLPDEPYYELARSRSKLEHGLTLIQALADQREMAAIKKETKGR